MRVIRNLLQRLFSLIKPKERKWDGLPRGFKRGRYEYNHETGKTEWAGELRNKNAMYPMWLQEYLHRKNHVSKGSWRRPTDKRYVNKEDQQDDWGSIGCKRGTCHPIRDGRCKYCGLAPNEIERLQKQKEKADQAIRDSLS